MVAALLLVGSSPFGLEGGSTPSAVVFGVAAFNIVVAVLTLLKGKLVLGMVSVFVPFVGVVGAGRLAKPRSLWAKHVYRPRSPAKLERTTVRYEASRSRYRRLHEMVDDLIGGAPSFVRTPMEVVADRLVLRPDGDRDAGRDAGRAAGAEGQGSGRRRERVGAEQAGERGRDVVASQ